MQCVLVHVQPIPFIECWADHWITKNKTEKLFAVNIAFLKEYKPEIHVKKCVHGNQNVCQYQRMLIPKVYALHIYTFRGYNIYEWCLHNVRRLL